MERQLKVNLYLGFFIIALVLRISIIFLTPGKNHAQDLLIIRDAGELIVHGINPYNFNDNISFRNQLRHDKAFYNQYTNVDQQSWNYFTNNNLPLATLFFGAVEYLFKSSLAFRLIFAVFDSLMAVLILAFVLNKWKINEDNSFVINKLPKNLQMYLPIVIGLFIGAFSPILLLYNTVFTEHKSLGLLLILSAIYFSDCPQKKYSIFFSPVLLGCSVSFIGLGAFVIPLCFYNIYKNFNFKLLALYCFISFLFCAIWLIPFLPEIFTMMSDRLVVRQNTNLPGHGSMWEVIYSLFGDKWSLIRYIFISSFAAINLIGLFTKRLNVVIITASLIYLFTCMFLISANISRVNVSLFTLIILVGYSGYFNMALLLSVMYFIYGIIEIISGLFTTREGNPGVFILLFTITYFIFLIVETLNSRKINNAVKINRL